MITPNFILEKKLFSKGYCCVAGVDEVGRGPWAGPVVAGVVVLDNDEGLINLLLAMGVRDSKQMTEQKRERVYNFITKNTKHWAVAAVDEKVIDEINILNASKLAMRSAVEKLSCKVDYLLIDGNHTLTDYPIDQRAIPKADTSVISVSVASVLAKVTRDRLMIALDDQYPGYGFAQHKGYGTKQHQLALQQLGPCAIHRTSFSPIKSMIRKNNFNNFN